MTDPAVSATPELIAPAAWRTVDFISDLHLQAGEPATFAAWRRYLADGTADAVFMLGDLFEVWVGDDAALAPGFEHDCGQILREAAARRALFFMPGNRDFLVGDAFLARCGVTRLADPTVLAFTGTRHLLSHGDALCLDDADYQQFRRQVRSAEWQRDFLARPLGERQALARALREQSEARKRSTPHEDWADVDRTTARAWLQAAGCDTLIHGHTHRPAAHDLGDGLRRVVLADWDPAARPPRGDVLRLTAAGLQRQALA